MGADPIEQLTSCSRDVDEATGQIQITFTWRANFSHLPSSYYNDTLDYTALSVFKAKEDTDYDDQEYKRLIVPRQLSVLSTLDRIVGLTKDSFPIQSGGKVSLVLYEVKESGSGFITVLGLLPARNTEFDHFLLLVSVFKSKFNFE